MPAPKYRKKPVVIEAVKWNPDESGSQVPEWPVGWGKDPWQWRVSAATLSLYIPTLEGEHEAKPGDMIIRGVKGEFYPCKADIFEMTYERVD